MATTTTTTTKALAELRQYFNPQLKDHFYTTRGEKFDHQYAEHGYWFEKVAAKLLSVEAPQPPNTVPMYRYWRDCLHGLPDHLYNTDLHEIGLDIEFEHNGYYGYLLEGAEGYCYKEDGHPSDTVPLYRYWSPMYGDHFYSVNAADIGTNTNGETGTAGYIHEGPVCYVYPPDEEATMDSADLKSVLAFGLDQRIKGDDNSYVISVPVGKEHVVVEVASVDPLAWIEMQLGWPYGVKFTGKGHVLLDAEMKDTSPPESLHVNITARSSQNRFVWKVQKVKASCAVSSHTPLHTTKPCGLHGSDEYCPMVVACLDQNGWAFNASDEESLPALEHSDGTEHRGYCWRRYQDPLIMLHRMSNEHGIDHYYTVNPEDVATGYKLDDDFECWVYPAQIDVVGED